MMAGIKGVNTKPETFLRSALHRAGFRFRMHAATLPGKPDIVLARYQAVILVQGCFWHGHGCHLFKWPETRREFWRNKIESTCKRDAKNITALKKLGFRVAVIWECEIRKAYQQDKKILRELEEWLKEMKSVAF